MDAAFLQYLSALGWENISLTGDSFIGSFVSKNIRLSVWSAFISMRSLLTACDGGNDLHFNSVLSASVAGMEETAGLDLNVNGNEIPSIKK
jgi:hypothetical protein